MDLLKELECIQNISSIDYSMESDINEIDLLVSMFDLGVESNFTTKLEFIHMETKYETDSGVLDFSNFNGFGIEKEESKDESKLKKFISKAVNVIVSMFGKIKRIVIGALSSVASVFTKLFNLKPKVEKTIVKVANISELEEKYENWLNEEVEVILYEPAIRAIRAMVGSSNLLGKDGAVKAWASGDKTLSIGELRKLFKSFVWTVSKIFNDMVAVSDKSYLRDIDMNRLIDYPDYFSDDVNKALAESLKTIKKPETIKVKRKDIPKHLDVHLYSKITSNELKVLKEKIIKETDAYDELIEILKKKRNDVLKADYNELAYQYFGLVDCITKVNTSMFKHCIFILTSLNTAVVTDIRSLMGNNEMNKAIRKNK